jgi:hypothetical protein
MENTSKLSNENKQAQLTTDVKLFLILVKQLSLTRKPRLKQTNKYPKRKHVIQSQ